MATRQLEFDFSECVFQHEDKIKQHLKYKPNKINPEDLTIFLDKYLSEYKEQILDGRISEGKFYMPKLDAVHDIEPGDMIPFNAIMSLTSSRKNSFGIFHFYIHDYQFERIWKDPQKYLPFLLNVGKGIGPDFSMYMYMHPAEAIINCCRNRLLTFYLQKKGMIIIPNVCFGNEQTFSWAFDGLPENSVLALSSQGCMNNNIAKRTLINGIHELDRRKHPKLLYVYGKFPEAWKDKFGMRIESLSTFSEKWRR